MWLCSASTACLWDSDTLADEAKKHGDIVEIITGRFPRNPPLYYEMRLERVSKELSSNPDELEDYDNAGVACDRLGRGDEAIEWMGKKRQALERSGLPKDHDHWYRYHANLGTFLAHRWFRNGKDFSDMRDFEQGAEHIRQALEINPNAHFGREEYQLKFMEWVLAKPETIAIDKYNNNYLRNFLSLTPENRLSEKELEKASEGLLGLIALGNAWESIDVFNALNHVHGCLNNTSICYLAESRAQELAEGGKVPTLWDSESTKTLGRLLDARQFNHFEPKHFPDYKKLRDNAARWHIGRTAFMVKQLKAGLHPDTHGDSFWDGYRELPKVNLRHSSFFKYWENYARSNPEGLLLSLVAGLALLTAMCIILALMIRWIVKKGFSKPAQL